MRIILNALLMLIVVAAVQKQAIAQDNGDFLSGIFGNQVETNQGQTNGGQSNNNNNTSDEFRLGIYDDQEGSDDSADAGDTTDSDTSGDTTGDEV